MDRLQYSATGTLSLLMTSNVDVYRLSLVAWELLRYLRLGVPLGAGRGGRGGRRAHAKWSLGNPAREAAAGLRLRQTGAGERAAGCRRGSRWPGRRAARRALHLLFFPRELVRRLVDGQLAWLRGHRVRPEVIVVEGRGSVDPVFGVEREELVEQVHRLLVRQSAAHLLPQLARARRPSGLGDHLVEVGQFRDAGPVFLNRRAAHVADAVELVGLVAARQQRRAEEDLCEHAAD
mmetsp:Transcript_45436/g.106245  ORF Transcript_45436/g.106245 Transcript_45436/m.106245 type:complete len:234 (+) Transcript_45436:86-787(+)